MTMAYCGRLTNKSEDFFDMLSAAEDFTAAHNAGNLQEIAEGAVGDVRARAMDRPRAYTGPEENTAVAVLKRTLFDENGNPAGHFWIYNINCQCV